MDAAAARSASAGAVSAASIDRQARATASA